MNPEIQRLIDESEKLVAQVQSGGLDAWCREQGLNRQKMSEVLAQHAPADAESRARAMFEEDLIDIQRDLDARSPSPAPTAASSKASAVRQRRRFGMV